MDINDIKEQVLPEIYSHFIENSQQVFGFDLGKKDRLEMLEFMSDWVSEVIDRKHDELAQEYAECQLIYR